MKAVILVVVLIFICAVLFATGLISPSRSRRLQKAVDRLARKGERKGNERGPFGDITQSALRGSRNAADTSAQKGRDIRHRIGNG